MFIDIHAHAYKYPSISRNGVPWFSTPEDLINRYSTLEINKAVLLPLVNSEVYLPQSNEEVLAICEKYPDTFIPFCNIDPRAWSNSAEAPLDYLLSYYKDKGCRGLGEVMPNLPFLDPLVQNLFSAAQSVGLPLIFDISTRIGGDYGLYDEPGLPQLQKSLENFPRLIILGHGPAFWSEIATLRNTDDRGGYPNYSVAHEGIVPKMFRKYPNLYGDLSARSGYNALARDRQYAAGFINEFQDRLLFGTDICSPQQPVELCEFLKVLKKDNLISQAVFDKLAFRNAEKLLQL